MQPNSIKKDHSLKINMLFRSLFATSASAIDTARAHQVGMWLDRVRRELARECSRGKVQHYRYDMNRHMALAAARDILALRLKELGKK